MAIGARILSNNLSGETANVTFLPATGGTIDLGTQTIPFNNITSYPYGVYEIYVPRYGYTYELTIEAPMNVKSFTFVSKLETNNNYGSSTLNFDDLTYEIIGLGVDVTGWYIQNTSPLTNSGYAYYFQNDNTCDLQWVIFVDSTGKIVEEYQTNCNCDYDTHNLNGKWVTFEDYYNGVFKYFDGKDVYTYNVDPSYQYIYTNYNWDGVMSGGNFTIIIENYTANTINTYIVNGSVLTPFGETIDTTTFYINVYIYFDGSFIVVDKYDFGAGLYKSFDIYDGTTGSLLQHVDLTEYGDIKNYERSFYGKNKFVVMYWNYSDNTVDYLILQYNGETDSLNIGSHARLNYEDYQIRSNSNLYPNNGGSEAFYIVVYTNSGYNNIGNTTTYCDVIYMLSGDTELQTYVFQNSGIPDKTIRAYGMVSNNIFLSCDNGDGYASVMSITSTGVSFHNTGLLMSNNPAVSDIVQCGNGYVGSYFDDNNKQLMSLIYILEDGSLGDLINGIILTGPYQRYSDSVGNVYQFLTYDGTNYYISPSSTTFQSGIPFNGNQIYTFFPSDRFRDDFIRPGFIGTLNYTTQEFVILSSTGVTSTYALPESGSFSLQMGDTMFMYTFVDTVSGLTNIHLYDFDFNLINSGVTEYSSWWSTESCGDNFVTIINEDSNYYIYLVKDTSIIKTTLTDYNDYYTFNDYIWWD